MRSRTLRDIINSQEDCVFYIKKKKRYLERCKDMSGEEEVRVVVCNQERTLVCDGGFKKSLKTSDSQLSPTYAI